MRAAKPTLAYMLAMLVTIALVAAALAADVEEEAYVTATIYEVSPAWASSPARLPSETVLNQTFVSASLVMSPPYSIIANASLAIVYLNVTPPTTTTTITGTVTGTPTPPAPNYTLPPLILPPPPTIGAPKIAASVFIIVGALALVAALRGSGVELGQSLAQALIPFGIAAILIIDARLGILMAVVGLIAYLLLRGSS